MIRLVVLCVVMLVSGCSSWGGASDDSPNQYQFAANSWLGAKIEGMVAAWGTPNKGYLPPDGLEEGIAGWAVWSKSGESYRYRCETLVHFNAEGTITRIVVKHSRSCSRRYNGKFGRMTRLEKAPIRT